MSYYIETAAWHAYAPLSYVRTLMASRLCQFTGQQVAVMASDGSEIHFASFEFQSHSPSFLPKKYEIIYVLNQSQSQAVLIVDLYLF